MRGSEWRRWAPAALVAGLAACGAAQAEDAPEAEAVLVRVRPAAVAEVAAEVRASGVVEARTAADVGFQVAGTVAAVRVEEGDDVRAGQLLATLETTDYALGVDQSAAAAEQAARELARVRPLLETGSVPANDVDRLESAARQTRAAAALARERLGDTRLASPIDGVVARRAVEPGETTAPGAPAFTIVDLDPVRVRVGVPEAEIGRIAEGQAATVTIPALPERTFAGRVTLIGVAADPQTRTFPVEVSVPNPGRVLRAGMVAEARVAGGERVRAVTVPIQAVVRDAEGATQVFLYDRERGRVYARRVEIGAARGAEVEVLRGLSGGEPVVVAGQARVREGARVRLAGEAPAAPEGR